MINTHEKSPLGCASGSNTDETLGHSSIEVTEDNKPYCDLMAELSQAEKRKGRIIPRYRETSSTMPDRIFIVITAVLLILVIAFTIFVLASNSGSSCTFIKGAVIALCVSSISLSLLILFYRSRDSKKVAEADNFIASNTEMKSELEKINPIIEEYEKYNYELRENLEKCQEVAKDQEETIHKLNGELSKYR